MGGDTTGGTKSAVFTQYCPNTTCGTDHGPGYVAGGFTLPAGSLTWNTSGATWTGGTGLPPSYQCNSGACAIDGAAPTKVVSASRFAQLTTWTSSASTTLSLTTPATLRKLQAGEVYRVDVVWTVSSGP